MLILGGLLGLIFTGMIALLLSCFTTFVLEAIFGIQVFATKTHDPKLFPWIMLFWLVAIVCFFIWAEWSERRELNRDFHGTTLLDDA